MPLETALQEPLASSTNIATMKRAEDPVCTFENRNRADSRVREQERPLSRVLYKLGRLMQLIGMILLPLAIAGNLSPENTLTLKQSLTLSGTGVVVFIVGWLLQQAGRPE